MSYISIESYENDILESYRDSGIISTVHERLREYQKTKSSWNMAMDILDKYSRTEELTSDTLSILVYCTSTMKHHAYRGFFIDKNKDKDKYSDIGNKLMDVYLSYKTLEPLMPFISQLSSILALSCIFSFDTTNTEANMLLLELLRKTEDGTITQYVFLSSIAQELFSSNAMITIEHRSSLIRACVMLSPRIFTKLLFGEYYKNSLGDILRMRALCDWIELHIKLLRRFGGFRMDQNIFENVERVYEDALLARMPKDDSAIVCNSLSSIYALKSINIIFGFIKNGLVNETFKTTESGCDVLIQLLTLCQIDIPALLILANTYYSGTPQKDKNGCDWKDSCDKAVSSLSNIIKKLTLDIVESFNDIADNVISSYDAKKNVDFIPFDTTRNLLSVLILLSSEHLPFALHFDTSYKCHVEKICNMVNLFLMSESYEIKGMVLDFWASFQSHCLPRRRDLTINNISASECTRLMLVESLRPLYEMFLSKLYMCIGYTSDEDLESLESFREFCLVSMRESTLLTGPEYVLKLVNDDLEAVDCDWNVLERCTFAVSTVAGRLIAGKDSVIRQLIMLVTDDVRIRELLNRSELSKEYITFIQRGISRLILWTSAYISKEDLLFNRVYELLFQDVIPKQYMDIVTDQAIIGLCYCLEPCETFIRMLRSLIRNTINNCDVMVEIRMEMMETILELLNRVPEPVKSLMTDRLIETSCKRIQSMLTTKISADLKIHILIIMSLNSIHEDVSNDILLLLKKLKFMNEFWIVLAKVYSQTDFINNNLRNFDVFISNRINLLLWIFENSKHSLVQLPLIKVLLSHNCMIKNNALYNIIIDILLAFYTDTINNALIPSPNDNEHFIDLLECTTSILSNWKLVGKLLKWDKFYQFIYHITKAIPDESPELNYHIMILLAKFVAWTDLPREVYVNSNSDIMQIVKNAKDAVRNMLNSVVDNNKNYTLLHSIISSVIKSIAKRPSQMDKWIPAASQIIAVLLGCKVTTQSTNQSLKNNLVVRYSTECRSEEMNGRGNIDLPYLSSLSNWL